MQAWVWVSCWSLQMKGRLEEIVLQYNSQWRNILSCVCQHSCLPSTFSSYVKMKSPVRWSICEEFYQIIPGSQRRPSDSQAGWGMHTVKCFNFPSEGRDATRAGACEPPGLRREGGPWRVYFGSVPQRPSSSFRIGFPVAWGAVCQVTHRLGSRVLPGFGATHFSLKPSHEGGG